MYTVTVTVTNEDEDEIYSEETYLETPKEGDSNEELLDMCSVIGDLGLDNCWFETSILEDCNLEYCYETHTLVPRSD